MNTEVTPYSNDLELTKEDIIKRLRALDPSIDVQERDLSLGGNLIEAKSSDENIPTVSIILNELGGSLIGRLEIIGNITQYIVDEIISFLQKNLSLAYLEVTDPKSGLIKFSLSKKSKDMNLFDIYKRELFNYHYPRDDGRLMVLYDQNSFWIHPVVKPSSLKPKVETKSTQKAITTIKKPSLPKVVAKTTPETKLRLSASELKEKVKPEVKVMHEVEISSKHEITVSSEIEKTNKVTKVKLDLSQREQMILKLVESKPNKKVQSKGLRKELPTLDQDTIRNILRSLVAKGLLYVRSAWYIVKEDPSEDTWDIASETPLEERLQNLTPKEKRIYEILEKRPGNKAQARMLVKETKMTKENLKKLLRNMVAKDILYVYAAWYCIKE